MAARGRLITNALMFLPETIRSAGEMGKAGELRFIVSVLCLDIKGAFDHVDHARLIETLRKKGIPGSMERHLHHVGRYCRSVRLSVLSNRLAELVSGTYGAA